MILVQNVDALHAANQWQVKHTVLLSLIGLSFVTEKCAVFQNQVPYNDVVASAHYTKNGVFFS